MSPQPFAGCASFSRHASPARVTRGQDYEVNAEHDPRQSAGKETQPSYEIHEIQHTHKHT